MISIPASGDRRARRDADRSRQLLQIGRALTAELDLDVLLRRILEAAREICGARYAALGVLDEDRHGLAQFLTVGEDPAMHAAVGHLPRGRGILQLLIDQPVPIRLEDVSQHPRSYGFPPGHPPMRGFLGAPVVIRDQAWGNLYLTEKRDGEDFDDEDLHSIVVLAEWAAIAIDNARLFGTSERSRVQLEHAVHSLQAARDIALALGGETELDRILSLIVTRARSLVSADSLLLWLLDGEVLHLAAHAGRATPPAGAHVPLHGSTAGAALLGGAPVRVDDVATGLSWHPAGFGLSGASSALIVPLIFRGRGLGVLSAFDHVGPVAAFSAEDERGLLAFAASAATAVATAHTVEAQRLRQTIAATEEERGRWARDLHDQTLQGLGAIKLALSAARRGDPASTDERLGVAISQLELEIGALRGIIADLRPPVLDELGLEPALRTLAAQVRERDGLAVELRLELGDRRLDPEIETIAYRVAQEALTNVVKHARAARAWMSLHASATELELTLRDDGRGFRADDSGHVGGGYGLLGMRERADIGAGALRVQSTGAGGTTVTLTLPLGRGGP
ncbi:MAG: sensor histidine kinase [Solirubrobacterales bacterium]|nr:sensor histidine kinase [Solirubrobacterales bacterium]